MRTKVTSSVGLVVAASAMAFVVCEALARFWVAVGVAGAAVERREFLKAIPPEIDDSGGYAVHPFLGYTFTPGGRGANQQGFFGPELPYRKSPDELVVGVFGGSVAMQASLEGGHILSEALAPAAAARGYTHVRVLSFAVGGWRAPQPFIALAHFVSSVDVAIVLDGFNEVIHLGTDALDHFPAAFPFREVYAPLVRGLGSPDEVVRRAQLIAANRHALRVTKRFGRPPLRWSLLAHLYWRGVARRYQERATLLRWEAHQAIAPQWRDVEPVVAGDYGAKRDAYLAFYADLVRDADAVTRRHGKPFFHFVQPNQYDRGSKPLSEEEADRRVTNVGWFDVVTPSYRRLEVLTETLRAEGVASVFLGHIFGDVPETVYKDDCCHLNERGLGIMNRIIAETIVESGVLATLPPPPTIGNGGLPSDQPMSSVETVSAQRRCVGGREVSPRRRLDRARAPAKGAARAPDLRSQRGDTSCPPTPRRSRAAFDLRPSRQAPGTILKISPSNPPVP